MNLSVGIVGLPNVGKSTLFNALLRKQVALVANYPFATIVPNVGVVAVPDPRLAVLAKIAGTEKIIPSVVEFYDIAGLVKGASEGEGLGNKFLSHIREVAAIVHVVRLFEDENIIHVSNTISPASDIETIDAELMLADLSTLEKQHEPRVQIATKEELATWQAIIKIKQLLNGGTPVRKMQLNDEERKLLAHLNLLTGKPVLFAFNVSEGQLEKMDKTEEEVKALLTSLSEEASYVILSAKLETDVLALSEGEQKEYLSQFKLTETGLNRMIREAFRLLRLMSFLTAGEKEVRAWTIKQGTLAPQAAGVIHTDFEKHFIKADVISYEEFVQYNGWTKAREEGKVQTHGRDYEMKEGDVVEFKIGT